MARIAGRLAAAALLLVLAAGSARAAAPDPALAANPALAALATARPGQAEAMLTDIRRRLASPPAPGPRASGTLDAWSSAILDGNPLLSQLYARDPAAALDLLARIKAAGKPK